MKKRASKRRWKARCAIGRDIPALAIINHRLGRWFDFVNLDPSRDVWRAVRDKFPPIDRTQVAWWKNTA
jgi:hypothetical protein